LSAPKIGLVTAPRIPIFKALTKTPTISGAVEHRSSAIYDLDEDAIGWSHSDTNMDIGAGGAGGRDTGDFIFNSDHHDSTSPASAALPRTPRVTPFSVKSKLASRTKIRHALGIPTPVHKLPQKLKS